MDVARLRHARRRGGVQVPFDAPAWPPAGAVPVDLTGLYEQAAVGGLAYGPAFQGLRAAWRRGQEIFAEAALPGQGTAAGFRSPCTPRCWMPACTRPGLASPHGSWDRVPFSWRGACIHAHGATAVRVRLTPSSSQGHHLRRHHRRDRRTSGLNPVTRPPPHLRGTV